MPPPTNGFAIGAIVCAVLLPPVGIVLGYVARSQIRRTGDGGRGLATAALVIGWILTLIPVVFLAAGFVVGAIEAAQHDAALPPPAAITIVR